MDPRLRLDTTSQTPTLHLSGNWVQAQGIPDPGHVVKALTPGVQHLVLDGSSITHWDTSLAAFLRALEKALTLKGIAIQSGAILPKGVQRLMSLVRSAKASTGETKKGLNLVEKLGARAVRLTDRILAWFWLAGMSFTALMKLLLRKNRVPVSDILEQIVECGPRALGIVTLLSFLIGGILAFVGVVQLRIFGAEIYMADLVGMGMLLEMGALMTGIIIAGRAGASFAAAIGTMQTNEEVDALQTLGFDPVEFLVMPRMLALTLMAPVLALYADIMGILGGAGVAWVMLDLSPPSFFSEMATAVHVSDGVKGLIKATAFGLVVSFAGCLRGIECGRSAQAVGQATTSAVVTSIVLIVLADAFLTVLYFVYDGMI
jgi:phospholipid/cholesterol/gamma-HCH transport system permease protein